MVLVSDGPSHVAKCAHKEADQQHESELRFVYSTVSSGHPDEPPVAERTGGKHPESGPDETTQKG